MPRAFRVIRLEDTAVKPEDLAADLVEHSCERLEHYRAQIVRCIALLDEQEIWSRPNPHVNSVANLILHLTGNVRQWILGAVGGIPIERDRASEFAARDGRKSAELLGPLTAVVCDAISVIRDLRAATLAERHTIQGYEVTAQTAVLHVVEHFAFHAGQVVHATKWMKDVDLSLYDVHGHRQDGSGHP
jgi:uncharacterized damage-inducible protein DinB